LKIYFTCLHNRDMVDGLISGHFIFYFQSDKVRVKKSTAVTTGIDSFVKGQFHEKNILRINKIKAVRILFDEYSMCVNA
jgi:hypothetical protein